VRATASVGAGANWFQRPSGLAVVDSQVFVADLPQAVVRVFDLNLEPLRTFGREGGGPGEFSTGPANSVFRFTRDWVGGSDGHIAVYDGDRISIFTASGEFLSYAPHGVLDRMMFLGVTRVAYDDRHLFAAVDEVPLGRAERRPATVYRVRSGSADTVLTVMLEPRPRTHTWGRDPSMSWDAAAGCVAATDGASDAILVSSYAGGHVDTIRAPIADPGRIEPTPGQRGAMDAMGLPSELPEPERYSRILDMRIDPDGHLWVRPTRQPNDSTIIVHRIPLGGGTWTVDTVPVFPLAFGPPGIYYAGTETENGEPLVVRFDGPAPDTLSS
jgi:hypothetical protein